MNWYKKAAKKTISQIATQVRNNLVKCYDDNCLRNICLPASRKLRDELIKNGYDAIVVRGTFKVDNPPSYVEGFEDEKEMEEAKYNPLHYWVDVSGTVIDITASQFNDELDEPVEPIQIGTYAELERYTYGTNWDEI